LSLTRTVTGAAALAALALVCGPALESASGSTAAPAAAISTPDPVTGISTAESAAPAPAPAQWIGALPIRPSRIAKVAPGSTADAPAIEAAVSGPPGATGALGIPLMVLRAYHQAADRLAVEQPSCKLPWWLLAGIGHTESGHAESGRLTADGTTRGRILGPRLNGGIPGDAIITDTDHGSYDGDKVYDRAVGPMQFIPSTWVRWGTDGNADGKLDPSNIFDATLAAGHYLCADGRDLATAAGLRAAVLSYNHSAPYLATVLAWGAAYRDGASALPDSPLPVVSDVTKVRPPRSSRPPKPTTNPSKLPAPAPSSSMPSTSVPSSSVPGSASPPETSATSGSAGASPSETASCASASPSPTGTASGTTGTVTESTTAQSLSGKAGTASTGSVSAKPGATGSATATPSASATAGTGTSSASKAQSTARSLTASSTSATATASPTLSRCTP
jgi:membrane-bound lytic murein transglycosylase B